MDLNEYDFELPAELIAQSPASPRDASRLLVVPSGAEAFGHARFRDLPEWLQPGDLLVLNDTRVLPSRFFGRRASGGRVELLLAERHADRARALARSRRPLREGERIPLDRCRVEVEVLGRAADGLWEIRLHGDEELEAQLELGGRLPLPPYIRRDRDRDPREDQDRQSYQTVFSRTPGAIAAPTAGLHFTPELLARIEQCGVEVVYVTLHVGRGTFEPIRDDRLEDHRMHTEEAVLDAPTAERLSAARARGGKIFAVGTTTVRVLESARREVGPERPWSGRTSLFLKPGDQVGSIDALVTNFHLPKSTLLLLVSAFRGRERILAAYAEAVRESYRFYSYGDAMLLL